MRRRRLLLRTFLALVLVGLVLGLRAFVIEPASLRVREVPLAIPGWPAERAGLRVALLSDLHVGSPYNGLDKLSVVVERTNAAHPDLVLVLGDLVVQGLIGGRWVPPERIAPVLAGLRAPLGVWCVLGNHDQWAGPGRVEKALTGAGLAVLEDRAVEITAGGPPFWLVGVSDYWAGRHDVRGALAQVTTADPVVLLTHNPDLFPRVPARVSLTVAGHTHGGQVWFPLVGRLVVPSKFGQRYAIGPVVEGGRHLFVTSGVGTSILPVRFLVPPEITILRLRPEAPAAPLQASRAARAR